MSRRYLGKGDEMPGIILKDDKRIEQDDQARL